MLLAHPQEQEEIENYITRTLNDLSRPNAVRLKAGLRILMTTDLKTFQEIISPTVQEELKDLQDLLLKPQLLAPLSCQTEAGRNTVLDFIREFTLNEVNLLDERISILPNIDTLRKSLMGGERLKSVVHSSALRTVVDASHFVDKIEKNFKAEGLSGAALKHAIQEASQATAALHQAVIEGDHFLVERLLKVPGVDVNHPNPDGLPLLHLAVREAQLKIVELLLKVPEIKVNLISITGWTPLQLCARLGFADIATAMLQHKGLEVNAVNSDGWSALHWAAWHGNTEIVKSLFLSPEIEINLKDSTQSTPLHMAARNGQADIIKLLTSSPKINLNPIDNENRTPLHYAIIYGHLNASQALLAEPGIDVNIPDLDGLAPLHWAARNGELEILQLLLLNPELKMEQRDHGEMTASDWAKKNEHFELIPVLMNPGSRTKMPKSGTKTAPKSGLLSRIAGFIANILQSLAQKLR